MPPKGRSRAQKGYVRAVYDTVTSPDNASVVKSIAAFGAAVLFLSSSWGEILVQ